MKKKLYLFDSEEYLEYLVAQKNLSPNTCKSYVADLNGFFNYLKNPSYLEVSEEEINDYIQFLSRNFSQKTHSRKLSVIKQYFSFLMNEKKCFKNPTINFTFPKNKPSLPKVLTEQEINTLINESYKDKTNYGIRLTVMLEILYATGIRVSELVNLKLSSFREDLSSILIFGKGRKERFVPLTLTAKNVLRKYLNIRVFFLKGQDVGYLFPSMSANKHITRHRFFQLIKDHAVKINFSFKEISPHIIRHSFATHLLDRGVDLRTIQSSLGHSDISSTQIYTHVQTKKFRNILENKHPLKKNIRKLSKF